MNDHPGRNGAVPRGAQPAVLRRLHLTLSLASGAMVGGMMCLTLADVIGRYLFSKPVFGAFEMTEILMGLVIFGGLPFATRARTHISVDFVSGLLPTRVSWIRDVVLDLTCAVFTGLLAWRVWLYGHRLVATGETTLELQIGRGLIARGMSVLLVVTALVFVLNGRERMKAPSPHGEER